jgi:hypothetical protein
VDEGFRELRMQRSAAFLARNARAVRRLQRAGVADPELDPDLTADIEPLAATLTRLWVNALCIETPHIETPHIETPRIETPCIGRTLWISRLPGGAWS